MFPSEFVFSANRTGQHIVLRFFWFNRYSAQDAVTNKMNK